MQFKVLKNVLCIHAGFFSEFLKNVLNLIEWL